MSVDFCPAGGQSMLSFAYLMSRAKRQWQRWFPWSESDVRRPKLLVVLAGLAVVRAVACAT